jgi:hypothetical protein
LAEQVLTRYDREAITFISGPRYVLVQLRVVDGVAETVFHAGEILATETRLELNGQFGFGMVIGRDADHATALAVLDAALRMPGNPHADLYPRIAELERTLRAACEQRLPLPLPPESRFETF